MCSLAGFTNRLNENKYLSSTFLMATNTELHLRIYSFFYEGEWALTSSNSLTRLFHLTCSVKSATCRLYICFRYQVEAARQEASMEESLGNLRALEKVINCETFFPQLSWRQQLEDFTSTFFYYSYFVEFQSIFCFCFLFLQTHHTNYSVVL